MQCCGGITNPFFTINPFQKDCCANGTTAPKGKCPIIEPTIYPDTTQTTEGYEEATTGSVTSKLFKDPNPSSFMSLNADILSNA